MTKAALTKLLTTMLSIFWLIGLLAVCLDLWQDHAAREQSPAEIRRAAERIKARALSEPDTIAIRLDENAFKPLSPSLIEPKNFLPHPSRYDLELMRLLTAWEQNCQRPDGLPPLAPEFEKYATWIRALCDQPRTPLPDEFFLSESFIHPLGGSWVAYAYRSRSELYHDTTFLKRLKSGLHVLELNLLPPHDLTPAERVLSSLSPQSLKNLKDGASLVLAPEWTLLMTQALHGWIEYRALPRAQWEQLTSPSNPFTAIFLRSSVAITTHASPECVLRDGEICWGSRSHRSSNAALAEFLFLAASFTTLLAILAWQLIQKRDFRREAKRSREMIVQTLAHEVRHPVTSLKLSLEVLRDNYDLLPEPAQDEFLRMADQMQRLDRVISASRQYLQTSSDSKQSFQFQPRRVDSLTEFIEQICAPYLDAGKIAFARPLEDRSIQIDSYWVEVCVTNLIKNALIHGAKPISVALSFFGDEAHISVQDAGRTPLPPLEELIKPFQKRNESPGMGLGLSLVHRLASLMGGRLLLQSNPSTTFILVLKEMANDKATAS